MRPEEAVELTRAVYRSYGYSYDWDDIYYPERIEALQRRGLMRSVVAVANGEVVGHLAVTVDGAHARVGEAGQAVVDPRFRGHRLFERLKTFAAMEAGEAGLMGLFSEATAAHPFSQKGNLHLGARETGFLLGYIPASVAYREIGDPREGRRGSVALFYMRTADEPAREVFPSARYEEVVRMVIQNNGLQRTIASAAGMPKTEPPILDVKVRVDHNIAFVGVRRPGPALADVIEPRLEELILRGVDCVYLDLPLSDPGTRGVDLATLGFSFGGILPERDSTGDVMRLQYLNEIALDPADVHTASPAGRDLLDFILADMKVGEGAPAAGYSRERGPFGRGM
jgi:serine/threonine-protein kinase RsbW